MFTLRCGICLLLALLVSISSPPATAPRVAHADESVDFRKHYDRAFKFYEAGQLQDSIKEFQSAYAIKQLPKLLLNLGQAHRRLGHAKDALGYYEFYLRVEPSPEPKLKAELDRYINQTRAMLAAAEKVRQEAKAVEEQNQEAAALRPGPMQPPPIIEPPPAQERQALATGAPLNSEPAPPRAQEKRAAPVYKRPWFWGVMGGVGAAVVAGVVTGVVLGTRSTWTPPPGIEIQTWSLRGRP